MTNYQEQIVSLTSSGAWTAKPSVSWIELPVSNGVACNGKQLTVRIEDNTSGAQRVGYVYFTGGSRTCSLTITQLASSDTGDTPTTADTITLSQGQINAQSGATTVVLTATSTMYSWSLENNNYGWINITPTSGAVGSTKVTVSVSANSDSSSRSGSITFKTAGGKSTSLIVSQVAKTDFITLSTTSTAVTSAETIINFNVSASTTWTGSSNASWATVGTAIGTTGKTTNTIAVAANDATGASRTATVTFTGSTGKIASMTISQNQGEKYDSGDTPTVESYLTIIGSLTTFAYDIYDATKEIQYLTISSSTAWSLSKTNADWLTPYPLNGNAGETQVSFKVNSVNSTKLVRNGVITFTNTDATPVSKSVDVSQDKIIPTVYFLDESGYTFASAGESHVITISSNVAWTGTVPTTATSWLSMSVTTGVSGQTRSTLTATENGTSKRECQITFTTEDSSATGIYYVKQNAADGVLIVSTKNFGYPATVSTGVEGTFTVKSSSDWKFVTTPSSWLHFNVTNGESGDTTVTFTIDNNEETSVRTFTSDITNDDGKAVNIIINQSGATCGYLYANTQCAMSACTDISYPWQGTGEYSNLSDATFPDDYYPVGITTDGLNKIELWISGTTTNCSGSQKKNYRIAFVYPHNAELSKIEEYDDGLTASWYDANDAGEVELTENFSSIDGVQYDQIIIGETPICNAIAGYRLTFNNGITKYNE